MSRAFTREEDSDNDAAGIGERPVSTERNLVTRRGLRLIDDEIVVLRERLARAEADADRRQLAFASRDLRYWMARRETAELADAPSAERVVRFGATVTVEDDGGKQRRWRIVGEDEADAAAGSVSHVSPMARALFGKTIGDIALVNGREWAIVGMDIGQP